MNILSKNIEMDFRSKCYVHLSIGIDEIITVSSLIGETNIKISLGSTIAHFHGDAQSNDETIKDKLISQIVVEKLDLIDQGFYVVPKSGNIKVLDSYGDCMLTVELSFEVAPEQSSGSVIHPMEDDLIPVGQQLYIHDTYEYVQAQCEQNPESMIDVEYNGDYYHVYAGNIALTYNNTVYLLNGQKAK